MNRVYLILLILTTFTLTNCYGVMGQYQGKGRYWKDGYGPRGLNCPRGQGRGRYWQDGYGPMGSYFFYGCGRGCYRDDNFLKERIYRRHNKIAVRLDLTKEQEKVLEVITEKLLKKHENLKIRETCEQERKLLYESFSEKKIFVDELKNLQKEKANKRVEFKNFRIDEYSKFYKILTNRQKDVLAEMIKYRRQGYKGGKKYRR